MADNKRTVPPKGTKRKARTKAPVEGEVLPDDSVPSEEVKAADLDLHADEHDDASSRNDEPRYDDDDDEDEDSHHPSDEPSEQDWEERDRPTSPTSVPPRSSAPRSDRRETNDRDHAPERSADRDRGPERSQDRGPMRTQDRAPDRAQDRDKSHSRDRDRSRDRDPRDRPAAPPAGPRFKPSEEYAAFAFYDKNAKTFAGSFLEFPEIKVTGGSRETVLKELDTKLENHLQTIKRRGEQPPEAFIARRYPEKLEVRISANLYRRLDILSRHEKVGLDQLVAELLSASVEKHAPVARPPQRQQHSHSQQESRGNQQPRHQQQQGHNRRTGGGNRNYHETMDNRENFMEYVRNLEKGGGPGNRWKK